MRIRVLDPNKQFWYPIVKDKKGNYMITLDLEASRFRTLDPGQMDIPGIQGVGYVRGILRIKNPYTGLYSESWTTQTVLVELSAFGAKSDDVQNTILRKFKSSSYPAKIQKFLSREYIGLDIKKIEYVKKGKDFSLRLIVHNG